MNTVDWSWLAREREGVLCHGRTAGRPYAVRLPAVVAAAAGGPPADRGGLAGREADLAALRTALTGAGDPCAVITGPPGVGKSALARALGHALHADGHFPGGLLTVELHGSDHARRLPPARVLDQLLRTLGLPTAHLPTDVAGRAGALRRALAAYAAQGRRVLLLLDDAAADDDLTSLMPTPGTAGVLVTARRAVPDTADGTVQALAPLGTTAATELLRRELTARGAQVPPDAVHGLDLRRLAKACGGLPAALLLAAAAMARAGRTAADTTREIERHRPQRHLDAPLAVLTAVHRLALDGLGAGPVRLLRLLALAPGPDFSTATARHLAGDGGRTVEADLAVLVTAGLVERAGTRWRATLQGDDDLALSVPLGTAPAGGAAAEAREARARLVVAHTELARAAGRLLSPLRGGGGDPRAFADRAAALAWLDEEHAANAGLLRRAAATGGPAPVIDLALALDPYLEHGLRHDELADAATLARDVAAEHGDEAARLTALVRLGRLRCREGRHEDALMALREAAEGARRIRHLHVAAAALAGLAETWRAVGQWDAATREGRRAAAIARQAGSPEIEYRGSLHAGIALAEKGRGKAAAKDLSRSIRVAEAAGDHGCAGVAHLQLGLVGIDLLGRGLAGAALFGIAFHAFREAGDEWRHHVAMGLAGRIGDDAGQKFLSDAAGGLLALGDEHGAHLVLEEAADALHDLKQHESAATVCRAVADFRARTGDPAGQARALTSLATALAALGRHEAAVGTVTEAVELARGAGQPAVLTASLAALGRALHDAGRTPEAVGPLNEAVAVAAAGDDPLAEVWAAALLGTVLAASHRTEEASAAFRRSRAAVRRSSEPVARTAVHPARAERAGLPTVTVLEATVGPGAVLPGAAARGPALDGTALDGTGADGPAVRSKGSAMLDKSRHHRAAAAAYAEAGALMAVAAVAAFDLGGPWATATAAAAGVSAVIALVAGVSFRHASGADVAFPAQVVLQVGWTLLALPVLLLHVMSLTRGELPLTGAVPSGAAFLCYLALSSLTRRAGRRGREALGV